MDQIIEVRVDNIRENPANPRKEFDGPTFEELVKSIESKGVLEPIIIRPIPVGAKVMYEVVCGGRRFKAVKKIGDEVIPCIIKKLDDDEAFDVMMIENLQREDLTEYEEAEGFATYLTKFGENWMPALSERTGIRAGQIRKHVKALELPKKIVEAWKKDKISFGHVEQFLRFDNDKEALSVFNDMIRRDNQDISPAWLKRQIEERAPDLHAGLFPKDGCIICPKNSRVQKTLFDIDAGKGEKCLDPKCFKSKQMAWLKENWKETEIAVKHKTNGFRIEHTLGWNEKEHFAGSGYGYDAPKPSAKCLECPNFISIISEFGKLKQDGAQVCVGKKECFKNVKKAADAEKREKTTAEKKKARKNDGGPRVPWHGEFFREAFYKKRIPIVIEDNWEPAVNSGRTLALALSCLIMSNRTLKEEIGKDLGLASRSKYYSFIPEAQVAKKVLDSKYPELLLLMKKSLSSAILQKEMNASFRRHVADFLGIDLKKEWSADDEYFQKKTIKELLEFGEKQKIFKEKKAQEYLVKKLGKKTGEYVKLKKAQLVELFAKCGVNLVGRVPDEILSREKEE